MTGRVVIAILVQSFCIGWCTIRWGFPGFIGSMLGMFTVIHFLS